MDIYDEFQKAKKEQAKIAARKRSKKWRLNNAEKYKEYQKEWNKKNRNEYQKKYREKHGYS